MSAKRYNTSKLRFELLPINALKKVVEVFTKGAHKYSDFLNENGEIVKGVDITIEELKEQKLTCIDDGAANWKKGLSWSSVIASAKRHIAKWEQGLDIDSELDVYHLASACTNLLFILEYYDIYPEGDDRNQLIGYKKYGLDIDSVIADLIGHMKDKFDDLKGYNIVHWNDPIFHKCFKTIIDNKDFWLNIPTLNSTLDITYEPSCYVTARPIPTEWTKHWLDERHFPNAPIYTVGLDGDKTQILLEKGINIFLEDNIDHYFAMRKAGIECYLLTQPHNIKYDVGNHRINTFKEFFKKIEIRK